MTSLTGKSVLVTGATGGIGLEAARALAARGARVFVHGRDPRKGRRAVTDIQATTGNDKVEFVQADFTSLASVRALADEVKRRAPRLDVLVNNAGLTALTRATTADGFELTLGVNHLAPFLLTCLLLEHLKASAPARIVTVASNAHKGPQIDFSDLDLERGYFFWRAYHRSKLANMLFTRALASRLVGSGVTANVLHPGVVRTGIWRGNVPVLGNVAAAALGPFLLSPEEGAKTIVYLASAPEIEGVSGQYFVKCKPAESSREAQDDAAAARLWVLSEELTGLAR